MKDDVLPSDRKWRTLIDFLFAIDIYYVARIPGWDPHKTVRIPIADVPTGIQGSKYVTAWVNIGAESKRDLRWERFEAIGPSKYYEVGNAPGMCFFCEVKKDDHGEFCKKDNKIGVQQP